MDRVRVYDIIYALAAQDGREKALFGGCGPVAREAFLRSLAGEAFPELWFEIPLAGEPWLDFHAGMFREDIAGENLAFAALGGSYADALAWFAGQEQGKVRQFVVSYDTHTGDTEHPAMTLLMNGRHMDAPLGFLEAAGRPDLRDAYSRFAHAIPPEWYACYVGLFPGRVAPEANPWVRVECIVGDKMQRAYADDAAGLREHLASVGMTAFDDGLASDVRELARSPFPLEFQFDVGAGGAALPVLSASVRFQPKDWASGEGRAAIGRIAGWLQERGLADGRCGLLPQTAFAKQVEHDGESVTVTCFPAFVKLRWREGEQPVAKAYLMARAS